LTEDIGSSPQYLQANATQCLKLSKNNSFHSFS
jgi:hypothetical protein